MLLGKLGAKLLGPRDSINGVADEAPSEARVVDVGLLKNRVEKSVKGLFETVDCDDASYDGGRIVRVADQDEAGKLQSKREVCRIPLFHSIAENHSELSDSRRFGSSMSFPDRDRR